jgi:hypothetical protein
MKSTTWLIGLILSILSVVMLVRHAYAVGFTSALGVALDFYEGTMRVLFGWAEPALRGLMRGVFAWDLQLYPHWKHVFVLMWIFLFQGAGNPFGQGVTRANAFLVPWAIVVALGASIAAGSIPMSAGDARANFFIATIPVVAVEVYWLGANLYSLAAFPDPTAGGTWARFLRHERDHLWYACLAVLFAAGVMLVPAVGEAQGAGLAVLALLMALYAAWLVRGAAHQVWSVRASHATWLAALLSFDTAKIGVGILGAFAGALAFVLTNAGLKLAGL